MKLVILDRDGVINYDSDNYIKSPEEWIPIPGSLKAISVLNNFGWKVAVATNQSGLARGLFNENTLFEIHQLMRSELENQQAKLDFLVWCPHGPHDQCECRKPKPGLYNQIGKHFRCSLQNVPVIGDSTRDLNAAVSVGARPILVKTGKGLKSIAEDDLPEGTMIYEDLQTAVTALLAGDNLSQEFV